MMLDPAIAVAADLFVFRCVVTITFDEPKTMNVGEVDTVARVYGITARSYSEAVGLLEELAGRDVDDEGKAIGPVDGWLDEIEVAVMDPEDVSAEVVSADAMAGQGVHFVSDPMCFDAEGDLLAPG